MPLPFLREIVVPFLNKGLFVQPSHGGPRVARGIKIITSMKPILQRGQSGSSSVSLSVGVGFAGLVVSGSLAVIVNCNCRSLDRLRGLSNP